MISARQNMLLGIVAASLSTHRGSVTGQQNPLVHCQKVSNCSKVNETFNAWHCGSLSVHPPWVCSRSAKPPEKSSPQDMTKYVAWHVGLACLLGIVVALLFTHHGSAAGQPNPLTLADTW